MRSESLSTPLVPGFGVSDACARDRTAAPSLCLDNVDIGSRHTVARVVAPALAADWASRLEDIGFIAGEQVMVTARAPFGRDPLVVRVGHSTFALRRAEAACVLLNTAP
ncbi:MAG: hypothetical protein NVS2B4_20410 [Ramlibacter sp.]